MLVVSVDRMEETTQSVEDVADVAIEVMPNDT